MSRVRGLKLLGVDVENIRSKATTCPKCSDDRKKSKSRCLSVNIESGHVSCNHCGWKARADSNEWLDKKDIQPITKPVNENLKPYFTKPLSSESLGFLSGRGISKETAERLRVAENGKGWICFNQYDGDEIFNCKYRLVSEKKFYQHGGSRGLYNVDAIKSKKSIVICEGEMDALSFEECGVPAVSIDLGAPNVDTDPTNKLKCLEVHGKHLEKLERIYLAVDKDENGAYLLEELIRRFGKTKSLIIDYPKGCKDANDVLIKFGKTELTRCHQLAKPVPMEGVIRLDDVWEEMVKGFKHGKKKGETTHVKDLDGHFSWYGGDSYIFTGNDGNGKSEIAKYLFLVKSVLAGWKWAVFSPEHHPASEFYDDLIHTLIGKSTDKTHHNVMSEREYELAASFIKDHFFFIYPEPDGSGTEESELEALHTPDNIRKKIKYLALTEGIKGYMIDPWNQMLHLGMDKREDLYLAVELSRFHTLDRDHDLVGVIVNHPRSMGRNADGSYPKPTKYDMSGGKMWSNKTSNIVIVHRPNLHVDKKSTDVQFDIQKIKRQKLVGVPEMVCFHFNVFSRQYTSESNLNPLAGAFKELYLGEQQEIEFESKEVAKPPSNIIPPRRNNNDDIPF